VVKFRSKSSGLLLHVVMCKNTSDWSRGLLVCDNSPWRWS